MPSFALLPNGGQCVTGNIVSQTGEILASTTYCWTTYGGGGSGGAPVYYGDGWYSGGSNGGTSGGTPTYKADIDIDRDYMPDLQKPVHCYDENPVKKAAANAAFNLWKADNEPHRMTPNFKKYLIHFNDGAEVWQWVNTAYSSTPLVQKTNCDN